MSASESSLRTFCIEVVNSPPCTTLAYRYRTPGFDQHAVRSRTRVVHLGKFSEKGVTKGGGVEGSGEEASVGKTKENMSTQITAAAPASFHMLARMGCNSKGKI